MSGKAPPTGPRALLGKQGQQGQQGQGQSGHPSHSNSRQPSSSTNISSSSSSLPSSSSSNVNTRIGAPPPTGPRSLSVNGPTRGGKAKVHVNGHSAGRERERERANSDSPSENASSSILTPRRFAISIPTKKPETNVLPKSSIQLRGKAFQDQTPKTPPQPTYDPPPPPPPAAPPPPAPPTNSPPPPPPPTNSPPPPPPPSNSPPPPPPPPKNSPPPSPPMPPPLAAPTGPKVLSATSNLPSKTLPTHNTISIALPATRPATSAAVPTQAQIQMQPPQPQPQPPPSRPHSPPKSPKYSLPPPLAWPPQKDQLPSDVRPHRVIFDSNVALLPAHELVSKDKDSREKEREARLAKDRALERAAFVSGYVKPGVKSQKPPPPNSFGTHPDLDTMMDIDFTKGEGTSTGAGTLAGSSMMGYNGYASLGRKTKEKGPGSEYFEVLAAAIKRAQTQSSSSDSCLRIQGKGKGKESITRYEGQVLAGGEWVWVPEEDVEASISAMSPVTPLASSSSTSIPSSVSSSASAFLAKFHSSNEASPIPVVVNGNEHGDEARGYWVCEKIPMPRDPRRMIVRDRDKLVSNEDIGGGTHSDGVDKEAQELWLKDREKKIRSQFYMLEQYEYDPLTSTSPPPPCKVIITNIALLTPTNVLRAHFSQYGTLMSFEPQIDKQNGSSLGILCIRYPTHAEAKRCVEKENGQKRPWAGAGYGPNGVGGYHDHALNGSGNWNAKGDAGDQIQVDFDGSGQKLAAVLKELEDRKNGRKRVDSAPRPNASPLITNDSNTPNHGSGNSALRASDHRTPTQTPTPAFKLPSSLPPRPSNLPLPPQSHSVSGSYSPAPSLPPPPASYQRSAPTPLHPSLPMRPMLDTRDSRERDRDRDRDRDRERDRDRDRLVLATPASSSTGSSSVHGGSTPRPNGTTPGSTAPLPSTSSSSTLPTNPNIPLKPSGITIATSMKAKPPPALMQARAHMKRNALLKRPEGEEDSALGSGLGTGNGTPVQIRLEKENATKENERNRARLDRGREVSRDRDRDWDRRRSRDRYGDRASLSYRRDDRDREQGRRIRSPSPGYRGRSPSRERYGSSSWRDSNRSFRRDRDRSDRNRSLSPYDDGRTYIPSHMRHSGFNAGYSRSHHYNSHRHDRSSPPPYLNSRREHDRFPRRSPRTSSRSPSSVRPVRPVGWEKDHGEVLEELGKSNFPYLRLEPDAGGQFPRQVQDEDVKSLLASFAIDMIFKSSQGIFVTFAKDSARRAATYINGSLDIKLAFLKVKATACAPPVPVKTTWTDEEMVLHAKHIITEELKRALQQDVLSKYIGPQLKTMINQHQNNAAVESGAGREPFGPSMVDQINARQQGLVGLSFKKQRKERKPVIEEVVQKVEVEVEQEEDEQEEELPPKKKQKKDVGLSKKTKKPVLDDEGESEVDSEDEDVSTERQLKKRPLPVESESELEEPVKKKPKKGDTKRMKKEVKKAGKKGLPDHVVLPDSDYDVPVIDHVRLSPGVESLVYPSRSVTPLDSRALTTPPPTPPPVDPTEGVCDDDEDLYYAKLVLSGRVSSDDSVQQSSSPTLDPDAEQSLVRKHITGSARTEGFYKITHAEKAAYVSQYQSRTTNAEATAAQELLEETKPQHVTSSRSNRANARRRAQGLEEINQVQRAVALSKGEAGSELTFKFNQLQTRKKHLRFARSPIHDWGLYAMERISRGEMVIEYVGEVIRAQVADKREKAYERQGIGSSYLFRIDEDLVVDATKKGNLGRLINHSCDPNCTAKIITISGEKKIVIYAKQDIELGDEITYDYHFPFEQDKIPCLCGSAKCRGFLN